MSEYKIALIGLPDGTQTFEYHLDGQFFEAMESADIRDAELTVELNVTRRHEFYDLRFCINGEITVACDRCLDDMVLPVAASYNVAVRYGERYNDENDDILEIPSSDRYLNVAPLVYDTVALTIPISHNHAEGECNADMSELLWSMRAADVEEREESGDETVTDPRWNQLKKLTDNN